MSQLAKTFRLSQVPLYIQVATMLRRRIEERHWAPGEKISTIEALQAEFGVARVTVRQAVELLEKEQLVVRQQGKGTFVAQTIEDRRWLKLDANWSSLIGTIKDNVPKFLPVAAGLRQPRLGSGEGVPAAEYVFLRSVQSRGSRAYSLVSLHLAKEIYDRDALQFRKYPALPILAAMKDVAIASARQTLVIGSADPETARLLKLPLNAPTAEAHCVVIDRRGIAIYVADIIYRGDCIKIETDLFKSTES
ncbi:MAG: GntR family transcriptional regulator [Alphaproteobacteria bacterium]|nr:GntR family transcriptional regulator [Alphaproteobacteria bacterium]